MVYSRGVVVWDGSVVLTGFFRWVLSWSMWSGLVRVLIRVGVCVLLREGCDEFDGAVGGVVLGGGGGFSVCSVACARIFEYPIGLIGELPD